MFNMYKNILFCLWLFTYIHENIVKDVTYL